MKKALMLLCENNRRKTEEHGIIFRDHYKYIRAQFIIAEFGISEMMILIRIIVEKEFVPCKAI